MSRGKWIVKPFFASLFFITAALLAFAAFPAAAPAAESAAPRPHMMYFYNPSCRLCTETNEVISKVETQYKDAMTFERIDIADAVTGADDVMYMFDLMDELKLPETDGTTLIVFLGLLETIDGELYFTPKRALVDGENIIEKLDAEITDFLAKDVKIARVDAHAEKGGSPAVASAAPFFFQRSRICLAHSA